MWHGQPRDYFVGTFNLQVILSDVKYSAFFFGLLKSIITREVRSHTMIVKYSFPCFSFHSIKSWSLILFRLNTKVKDTEVKKKQIPLAGKLHCCNVYCKRWHQGLRFLTPPTDSKYFTFTFRESINSFCIRSLWQVTEALFVQTGSHRICIKISFWTLWLKTGSRKV